MPPKLDRKFPTERLHIYVTGSWIKELDKWRRKQSRIPTRSDAIRKLVVEGLFYTGNLK